MADIVIIILYYSAGGLIILNLPLNTPTQGAIAVLLMTASKELILSAACTLHTHLACRAALKYEHDLKTYDAHSRKKWTAIMCRMEQFLPKMTARQRAIYERLKWINRLAEGQTRDEVVSLTPDED